MEFVLQLENYLRNPGRFSVLLLGERGVGKTKWVQETCREKLVIANCASFSDDTMAESELFGYKKGAFTDAKEDKNGLFDEADNGALFFDEVHNLSPRVQEKIMTALQTESKEPNKGKFRIRKVGETKSHYVTVRPIFASNLPLKQLREKLMPDLYDRISQLVIEIPSIQDSKIQILKAFHDVWTGMQFVEHPELPNLPEFEKWIKKIHLEGNYRTLQNMAINWHQGRLMKLSEDEVFAFVKKQIEQFHKADGATKVKTKFNFQKGRLKTEMEKEYRKAMYDWAKENYQGLTDKERHYPAKCVSRKSCYWIFNRSSKIIVN